ncbi:MAG: hypothetical protein J6M53_02495 [Bacteroidaceae bacterium]|nr:hypothetical protein [Bacteroidaceae bacterium]
MRPLTPLQNLLLRIGGVLMLVALVLPIFFPTATELSAAAFGLGALLFGAMQLLARYDGRNVTLRHLRRQQIAGALFLIVTAMLLVGKTFRLGPLRGDEWKLALAVAAVFEVYTAFRIPAEAAKEEKRRAEATGKC